MDVDFSDCIDVLTDEQIRARELLAARESGALSDAEFYALLEVF